MGKCVSKNMGDSGENEGGCSIMPSWLSKAASKFTDFAESKVQDLLTKCYPDLQDILPVLASIKERVKDTPDGADTDSDNKWRPTLLTAALLFKMQKQFGDDQTTTGIIS